MVGYYKKRANVVGGRETSKPSEVQKHMKALLEEKVAITVFGILTEVLKSPGNYQKYAGRKLKDVWEDYSYGIFK